jgi:tRNA(fMet)-specific endonuclease VapC
MMIAMGQQAVSVAEAKRSLSELLSRVAYRGESIVIVKRGKPVARLVPVTSRRRPSRPPAGLAEHLRQHALDPLFTSCICVMELRHGAMRRADHGALWSRIEREVLARVELLGIGVEEAMIAGDTMAHLWARGQIIDVEDVLIGATALARNLTVVTNNLDHFRRIPGLRVEDWTE